MRLTLFDLDHTLLASDGDLRWCGLLLVSTGLLAQPAFERLRACEQLGTRTPIAGHRAALCEAGAPVAEHCVGSDTPRRGLMSI